jgi:hypothetical protein
MNLLALPCCAPATAARSCAQPRRDRLRAAALPARRRRLRPARRTARLDRARRARAAAERRAPRLLDALLALGVALREIARRPALPKRGRRARAVAAGDALEAVVTEYVTYHAQAYLDLPRRLAGAPPLISSTARSAHRALLAGLRAIYARIRRSASSPGAGRCACSGSACWLERLPALRRRGQPAGARRRHRLQADVVANTARSLAEWGLAERFRSSTPTCAPAGRARQAVRPGYPYSNVYYFPVAERRRCSPACGHASRLAARWR